MTQTDSDPIILEVTSIGRDGKRRYSRQTKRRLVEACLQPGVSVAGLALKAGVNANLLRRWIKLHQQRHGEVPTPIIEKTPAVPVPSSFVPVVETRGTEVVGTNAGQSRLVQPRPEPSLASSHPSTVSQLTAQMPNGITLRLECTGQDVNLMLAMIETLGRCNVPAER